MTIEKLIESVDIVLSQLRRAPWAFRLEEGDVLVSDPDCAQLLTKREDDWDWEDVYRQEEEYRKRIWEEYGEIFSFSPFSYIKYEKLEELDWMDISAMTWQEIMDDFLKNDLKLVRKILRSKGYAHEQVPEDISDEALNQMIAFRYKEGLVTSKEMEFIKHVYEAEIEEYKGKR